MLGHRTPSERSRIKQEKMRMAAALAPSVRKMLSGSLAHPSRALMNSLTCFLTISAPLLLLYAPAKINKIKSK